MANWIKEVQDGVQAISENNKFEKLDCLVVIAHQEEENEDTNTSFSVVGSELGILLAASSFFKENPEMADIFQRAIALSKIDITKPFKKGICGWLQKKKLAKILQK